MSRMHPQAKEGSPGPAALHLHLAVELNAVAGWCVGCDFNVGEIFFLKEFVVVRLELEVLFGNLLCPDGWRQLRAPGTGVSNAYKQTRRQSIENNNYRCIEHLNPIILLLPALLMLFAGDVRL